MCTGIEIAMLAGSVLSGVAAVNQMTKKTPGPQVIKESPLKDQAEIEAAARMAGRRRARGTSLLATGGAGDTSPLSVGQPGATAVKTTLGG